MSFGTRYGFGTVVLASNGTPPIVEALLPRDGTRPMVGDLDLARDPSQDQHATSKRYVDDLVATFFPDAPIDGVLYGRRDALWVPSAPLDIADDRVLRAGDTMIGDLLIRKYAPAFVLDENGPTQQIGASILFRRNGMMQWSLLASVTGGDF